MTTGIMEQEVKKQNKQCQQPLQSTKLPKVKRDHFKAKRKLDKKEWKKRKSSRKKKADQEDRRKKHLERLNRTIPPSVEVSVKEQHIPGTSTAIKKPDTSQIPTRGKALVNVALASGKKRKKEEPQMETVKNSNEETKKKRIQSTRSIKEIDPKLILKLKDVPELGRGTFGSCYLADYRGMRVAVKEFLTTVRKKARELRADALREAFIIGDISDHRGVPFLFGACTTVQPIRIVLMFHGEGVTNLTISHASKDKPGLTANKWRVIFSLVCSALQHIHECGYIHNDLKGNNVVLERKSGSELNPVIIDFGRSVAVKLAKPCTPRERPTNSYLAPELYSGVAPPTFKSDIYSLGKMIASVRKYCKSFPMPPSAWKCFELNPVARPNLPEVKSWFEQTDCAKDG